MTFYKRAHKLDEFYGKTGTGSGNSYISHESYLINNIEQRYLFRNNTVTYEFIKEDDREFFRHFKKGETSGS